MKDNMNILSNRKNILEDNIWKIILTISVPIAFVNLCQRFYNIVDTYFSAHIGVNELASVSVVMYLNNLFNGFGMGFSVAGTILIARKIGAKDFKTAKDIIIQLYIIMIIISLSLVIIVLPFSKRILELTGVTINMIDSANVYFRLNIVSLILLLTANSYIGIMRGMANIIFIVKINVAAIIIKILFCYFLLNVKGLGVQGLVYSSMIARGMICIYAVYDLFIKESIMKISLTSFRINKALIGTILVIGIPLAIERSTVSFGNIILSNMSMFFGEEFIAARGVVNRIISLGFSILTGFSTGIVPLIGQNIGAHNFLRVKEIIKKSIQVGFLLSVLTYCVITIFKTNLIHFFISNTSQELLNYISDGISIYSVGIITWGIYQVGLSIFKGFRHTKINLTISLIRLFAIRLPLVFIFIHYTSLNTNGVWIGMLFSNLIGTISVYLIMYFKYYRNNKYLMYIGTNNNEKSKHVINVL